MTSLHQSARHHIYRSRTDLPSQTTRRPVPNRSATYQGEKERVPWEHMARTYEWVVRHEYILFDNHDKKTEQWILEQQIFLAAQDRNQCAAHRAGPKERIWEDVQYSSETQATRGMRHEGVARQNGVESEARAKLFRKETERAQYKREAERRKFAEERHKAYEELRNRERRNEMRAKKLALEAWNDYEKGWSRVSMSSEPLTFSSIPWPVLSRPDTEEDIKPAAIALFLLSPAHSEGQARKERIRSAQLRWHPDRFQRVLGRVADGERAQVERAVGIVARSLNDMMART